MGRILKKLASTKWLILSALIVLLITIILSQVSTHLLDQRALSSFFTTHYYFWLVVKIAIVVGFFLIWPTLVKRWANQYKWTDEQTAIVLRRRWRYVIWLTVIYFIFKLL